MHFDTEEGTLQRLGQIDHPAVTAVCYLKEKGDPTVVFNQSVFDEEPTQEAYVSHPIEDSVLIYSMGTPTLTLALKLFLQILGVDLSRG